jgi:hypothetical protein
MRAEIARPFLSLLLVAVLLSAACSREIGSKQGPLSALTEKVREKQETTKIGGEVALGLGLRAEEVSALGHLVSDGKEHHAIMVTDANDIILIFGSSSVAYFCRTDLSGKLRRVFRAEPGKQETDVAVSDAQPRFEEEIVFWKTYLGVAE